MEVSIILDLRDFYNGILPTKVSNSGFESKIIPNSFAKYSKNGGVGASPDPGPIACTDDNKASDDNILVINTNAFSLVENPLHLYMVEIVVLKLPSRNYA